MIATIAFWLLGRLRGAFQALAALRPATLAIVALALLSGGLLWRLNAVGQQRDQARVMVKAERYAHAVTKRNFIAAAKQARNVATENKRRVETAQETARKEADEQLDTIRADFERRTADYARRMRTAAAADRNTGPGDLPGPAAPPKGPDGPGDTSVVLTRADLDILVANTARLVSAQHWAETVK